MKSLEQQLKVLEDYEEKISDIITLVEHDYTIHLQSKDIISFKTSQEYIEISKNGKIGLMNSDCKILIQPSFDAILSYNHENRTLVFEMRHWDKQLERKEGVANFKGDILLQPKYDRILYYDSTLYVVLLNGQYGIIDKEGRTLVDFGRFDYIDTFVDGLARTKKNNRWGIINADGDDFNCLTENILEIFSTKAVFGNCFTAGADVGRIFFGFRNKLCFSHRVGDSVVEGHILNPACALMGKEQGVIAMEVIHNIFVKGLCNMFNCEDAVVHIAADENFDFGSSFADFSHGTLCNFHPRSIVGFLHNLVEQFNGKSGAVFAVTAGKFVPKSDKPLYEDFTCEKACLCFIVKNKSCCLVQIKNHIQAEFSAPVNAVLNICKSAFDEIAVFVLYKFIVNWQSYVVKADFADIFNVRFCDEGVAMLLCEFSL